MAPTPRTILLIDPDADRKMTAAQRLLAHGFSVLVADNMIEARIIVRNNRPSAVLMDSSYTKEKTVVEKLFLNGLNVDVPIIILADEREPLAGTSLPYGVLARPLSDAGINSLKTLQGLPVGDEIPVGFTPNGESQASLLYALPHEYRTPLTDIIGSASYLHGHAESTPDEIRDISTEIMSAARRLLRTTDNFLVYAQIETLAESPLHIDRLRRFTTHEPASVVYEAVMQRALTQQRSSDMSIGLNIDGVGVAILEQHLQKVTSELVDNALYFSRPGSPVSVHATTGKNEIIVTVRDHGVGMNDNEVHQVGAYRQFRRSMQEQQGIGLGLIIAKRLIELHGGTFTISSTLGMGTSITFSIPRAA